MPFLTILKYPFTQLHKFYAFLSNAKSTRWPGLSRCGPSILILALLLSIVQISLHLWLAITISELPTEVQGCYEGHGIIGLPVPHEAISRPVTYADVRGKMAFSVNGNAGIGYVSYRVVLNCGFCGYADVRKEFCCGSSNAFCDLLPCRCGNLASFFGAGNVESLGIAFWMDAVSGLSEYSVY